MSDPELLNMDRDISLVEGRIIEALSRLDDGESGVLWIEVQNEFSALDNSIKAGNTSDVALRLTELKRLITQGADNVKVWHEVDGMIEKRRKLIESEWKNRERKGLMLQAEEAWLLIKAFMGALDRAFQEGVPIVKAKEKMANEIVLLLNAPGFINKVDTSKVVDAKKTEEKE
jgi:hypothetical protein